MAHIVKFRDGVFAVRRTKKRVIDGSKYSYLHKLYNRWLPLENIQEFCYLDYEDAQRRLEKYQNDTTVDYGTPFSIPPGAE